MSAIVIKFENSAAASFPKGTDRHWITENRILWNQEHRKSEECELVYEVSWVPELGEKLSSFAAVVGSDPIAAA